MRAILLILLSVMMSLAAATPASRLEIQKVADDVYALVGQRGPMSKWNFGANVTFGIIVTGEGVVLVDSGASDKAARYLHDTIRQITDKPVVLVINTGSEDLRWVGDSYFKSLGARIITSNKAPEHQRQVAGELLSRLQRLISPDFAAGTRDVYADETFGREKVLTISDTGIVLRHPRPAYMPGDLYVWLPRQKVAFSGDMISTERMLAVARVSRTQSWIRRVEEILALTPMHIVPGHGHATDIATAKGGHAGLAGLAAQVSR